jgi:hypothetical protein
LEEVAQHPDEQRQWRAYDQSNAEYDKCERSCRKQRELLRQVADLAESERAMYELDHAKDQVMTTLKLALANLVMWARDRYFPATYGQATWHRLGPFFRLPGRVVWGKDRVLVELCSFNDRQLNRDLRVICEQVTAAHPSLPDGQQLCLTIAGTVGQRMRGPTAHSGVHPCLTRSVSQRPAFCRELTDGASSGALGKSAAN